MPAAKSFRLPEELVERVTARADEDGVTQTELVSTLLDEGLRVRAFPGIVHRDGPTGRRAAVAVGPDVWEIIDTVRHLDRSGEAKLLATAELLTLDVRWVRLAVEYYAAFPADIDERIVANDRRANQVRKEAERRERLLA